MKRQTPTWTGWTVALTMVWSGPAVAQGVASQSPPMQAVRQGGVTLLCRHARTTDFRETEPIDYNDAASQRRLSREGEDQAKRMGDAFRSLNLVPLEIVASPMDRARRTAELMFDGTVVIDSAWHTNGSDFSGEPMERRARALSASVRGGNRLVVSHIGTMRSALGRSPGDVREGDCVVVRPNGRGHDIVGIIPWQAWLRAAGSGYARLLKHIPTVFLAARLVRTNGFFTKHQRDPYGARLSDDGAI